MKLTGDIVITELSSVTASSTINRFGLDFVLKIAVAKSSLKLNKEEGNIERIRVKRTK